MEKRKNSLCSTKLCRFCLTQDDTLSSIYQRNNAKKNIVNFSLKILSAVSIEVFPSDRMPSFICGRCKFFIDMCYEYKQVCRRADENILNFIQNGSDLETVEWPTSLLKLFSQNVKPKTEVIKTVVQGGATVEVSQHDIASESDDDEQVINIQIEDGSDEETKGSTCIKLVTTADKTKQGFGGIKKAISPEKSISCKFCKKKFMKSHHYQRHLRLKHRDTLKSGRGPFAEQYQCEQCDVGFGTQDELIYHSAIHATQNLTCPLCQEKFQDVDGVTAHIKTHVNGTEFMCDLCELVFTSKEKLDNHITIAHEDEMRNEGLGDESSMDMDAGEEDDEAPICVKEEDGEMVVEIKKPEEFMKSQKQVEEAEDKPNINSEESEQEVSADGTDTMAVIKKNVAPTVVPDKVCTEFETASIPQVKSSSQVQSAVSTALPVLKKSEDIKRKADQQIIEAPPQKKDKPAKVESSSNTTGANDKSLRLLEKELQELKRTNRNDPAKVPIKTTEQPRSKRPQLHTSTPKSRVAEERKTPMNAKSQVVEKKFERRVITKENKEPKEEREVKEPATPKVVKNGSSEKSTTEDGPVRRSTRPSKIKDYAKMIRDKSQDLDDDSEDSEDEEYQHEEKTPEPRPRGRPSVTKKAAPTPAPPSGKKRGRPRKDASLNTSATPKKQEDNDQTEAKPDKTEDKTPNATTDSATVNEDEKPQGVLVSPSGQTLKKVPIKSLPPGVKPLPLPLHRPKGELCEMQIGKKMVKVQKIVMTKAEVEAMTKKGLVEMKDGTMVLKQGIKLPTSQSAALKTSLDESGDTDSPKEHPVVKEKVTPPPAPSRCDFGDD